MGKLKWVKKTKTIDMKEIYEELPKDIMNTIKQFVVGDKNALRKIQCLHLFDAKCTHLVKIWEKEYMLSNDLLPLTDEEFEFPILTKFDNDICNSILILKDKVKADILCGTEEMIRESVEHILRHFYADMKDDLWEMKEISSVYHRFLAEDRNSRQKFVSLLMYMKTDYEDEVITMIALFLCIRFRIQGAYYSNTRMLMEDNETIHHLKEIRNMAKAECEQRRILYLLVEVKLNIWLNKDFKKEYLLRLKHILCCEHKDTKLWMDVKNSRIYTYILEHNSINVKNLPPQIKLIYDIFNFVERHYGEFRRRQHQKHRISNEQFIKRYIQKINIYDNLMEIRQHPQMTIEIVPIMHQEN